MFRCSGVFRCSGCLGVQVFRVQVVSVFRVQGLGV